MITTNTPTTHRPLYCINHQEFRIWFHLTDNQSCQTVSAFVENVLKYSILCSCILTKPTRLPVKIRLWYVPDTNNKINAVAYLKPTEHCYRFTFSWGNTLFGTLMLFVHRFFGEITDRHCCFVERASKTVEWAWVRPSLPVLPSHQAFAAHDQTFPVPVFVSTFNIVSIVC